MHHLGCPFVVFYPNSLFIRMLSLDTAYKYINVTIHDDGFDKKSELYKYRVTWFNPPKPVDSFQVHFTVTNQRSRSRSIKAVRIASLSCMDSSRCVMLIEF
jgi:hypothetical protein